MPLPSLDNSLVTVNEQHQPIGQRFGVGATVTDLRSIDIVVVSQFHQFNQSIESIARLGLDSDGAMMMSMVPGFTDDEVQTGDGKVGSYQTKPGHI